MQAPKQSLKSFRPYKLEDFSALTPDNPEFYKVDMNVVILTKYGRGIYIRHGNEDRCSSYFATLGTIINKLQLSFGTVKDGNQQPANLKCIRHGPLKLYLLRRLNYMYICWSKLSHPELTLYAMLEFVHHQLQSCLTGKVNAILDTNQTYDPSINFGKTKNEQLLLHYAVSNGLYSLPVVFNAIPVLPLPSQARTVLYGMLKEQKIEGLRINILMTMGEVVCIHKQKGIDLSSYDIFLLNTLIQSQSSLFASEIWYPICLPGVCLEERVFCYINFITDQFIHIMVADEAGIFPQLSKASKRLKAKIDQGTLMERLNLSCFKELITDVTLDKTMLLKHFICRLAAPDENHMGQMVMSSGAYFGQNQKEMQEYMPLYGELLQHYATHRTGKKEKVHIQPLGQLVGGYCEESGVVVFFLGAGLSQLEDCRQMGMALSRYLKEEDGTLWLHRIQ